MIVKIHKHEGKIILAVCDKEILGKKYVEDDKQLDLTSPFYKGIEIPEQELKQLLKRAYVLNIVGKKSIKFALNERIIVKDNIIIIKNIPHAQALLLRE